MCLSLGKSLPSLGHLNQKGLLTRINGCACVLQAPHSRRPGAAAGGRIGKILWSGCSALPLRATNSPYFVTSAFLGDYLATLGKPELLGAALGWLIGSQLVAMAVLFLTANRLQMRAWPFLVFGPTMLVAFLVMMIFVTSSLAIVGATAVIGIAGAVSMTAILALPPFLSLPADVPRTAAGMFTIG